MKSTQVRVGADTADRSDVISPLGLKTATDPCENATAMRSGPRLALDVASSLSSTGRAKVVASDLSLALGLHSRTSVSASGPISIASCPHGYSHAAIEHVPMSRINQ